MMTKTRKFSSFILSISMLFCVVPATNTNVVTDLAHSAWEHKAVTIPGAALFASFVMLYSRVPKKTAKPEYEINKLTSNPISLDYWKNIWAFYRDGFVGQCSKSASLKADLENGGKIELGTDAESFGVLGKGTDYLKASETAIKSIIKVAAVAGVAYYVASGKINVAEFVKNAGSNLIGKQSITEKAPEKPASTEPKKENAGEKTMSGK